MECFYIGFREELKLTKNLSAICASRPEDLFAARVLSYERCDIVDLALDHSPAILLGVMLSDLLDGVSRRLFILCLEVLFIELREKFLLLFFLLLLESLAALILPFKFLHYDLRRRLLPLVVEQLLIIFMFNDLIKVVIIKIIV